VLYIFGRVRPTGSYNDLEVNYTYPRGTKLKPHITLNGSVPVPFAKVMDLEYEIGSGYDLRAEEFEAMSLWTGLNHYPQLGDGIASPGLVYQFENGKQYHTVGFEACAEKSGLEGVFEGDNRKWHILLGTEDSMVYSTLANIFG